MASRSGARRGALGIAAACLLIGVVALVPRSVPAHAAPPLALPGAVGPTRPALEVASARIAIVRVLASYSGGNNVPVPVPCAADGALIGTTGDGLNPSDYVLVPTAVVNPSIPCEAVQAAYQQLYGTTSTWNLTSIKVLFNAAYTGSGAQQLGSIQFTIDPSQILTSGGANAPQLLALPLDGPTHDLPVLALPQPSDAPPTNPATMLDLAGPTGDPLASGSLPPTSVVYPIDAPAGALVPAPPGAAGTASPTAASIPAAELNVGAVAINANGRLIGMIVTDAKGNHVLAGADALKGAIDQVSGRPGTLMQKWLAGLAAFYATPPQFAPAAAAFGALASGYKDFGGVAPFAAAARQSSLVIPPLTQAPASATPTPRAGGIHPPVSRRDFTAILAGAAAAVIVLLLILALAPGRRRSPLLVGPVPLDEDGLDLLPRESMYIPSIEDEPTRVMVAVRAPASDAPADAPMEDVATAVMAIPRRAPAKPRQGASLMPHAAGLTDPGIKRAREPNQDSILALQGIRVVDARPQPYGLFIVADGMGGHEHGQEASRTVIELVTRELLQSLNGNQSLDEAACAALLRESVQRAHAALRERNASAQADMGTTITAALVLDDRSYVANVGDSRTYLMSPDSGLRQITTDHSIVASLVAAGVIRPEDIYSHPRRNQIYRSLGGEMPEIEVDTFTVTLQAGDKLLLCSDGLWEMVHDPQIAHILRATADPRQAVELLVREANTNGGEDNIGALVVRMLEDMPPAPQPGMRILFSPESA